MDTYRSAFRHALDHPEAFWAEQSKHVQWYRAPSTIVSTDENETTRWFADGELNTSYLAVDYHIENGRGDQLALIYDSPVTDSRAT